MKRRARGTACYHMYVCFLGEEKGWGGRTTYMSEAAYRLMKVFGYHMGPGEEGLCVSRTVMLEKAYRVA